MIEIDGDIHDETQEYDGERDRILASRSLKVLRFSNGEIRRDLTAALLTMTELALNRRHSLEDTHAAACPPYPLPPSRGGKGGAGLGPPRPHWVKLGNLALYLGGERVEGLDEEADAVIFKLLG